MKRTKWNGETPNDDRIRKREGNGEGVKLTRTRVTTASQIVRILGGSQISPNQYMAHCPAHNDKNPSLAIKEINNLTLLHCFAGCNYERVANALESRGIKMKAGRRLEKADKLPKGIYSTFNGKFYVAHWQYRNESGDEIGYVVRYENESGEKETIPYFNKKKKKWRPGYPKDELRSLYNLDKVIKADSETKVWIVEGEKCADALTNLGCIATTSPGGAKAVSKADWFPLDGRKVIIWRDNDQAGREYEIKVYQEITGDITNEEHEIKIVDVEALGLEEKQDVYDWIEIGNGEEELSDLPFKCKSSNNLDKMTFKLKETLV